MELSPINQSYLNNVKNSNTQALSAANSAVKSSNLAPLQNDSVEITSKKPKENTKKALLFGAGIGVTLAAVYGLVKCHNANKIKKLIAEQYNKLADDVAEHMKKSGFDFVKPELKFEKLDKSTLGGYLPNDNTIRINKNNLSIKNFYKAAKEKGGTDSAKEMFVRLDSKTAKKMGLEKGTLPEFLMDEASILAHELEHARQLQMSLHGEGAKDYILSGFKKQFPELSDESIKKIFPFVFSFTPKKEIPLDQKIATLGDVLVKVNSDRKLNPAVFEIYAKSADGKNVYTPMFTPKSMIESLILDYKTGQNDYLAYVTNVCEVYARRAEIDVLNKLKFEGVDKETLKAYKAEKQSYYNQLIKILAK